MTMTNEQAATLAFGAIIRTASGNAYRVTRATHGVAGAVMLTVRAVDPATGVVSGPQRHVKPTDFTAEAAP
jgi:hypothetical protein